MNFIKSSVPSVRTGRVILFTGPPGAGKTTIAKLVADQLNLSVHLHADDFWHCIRQGAIAPYLPEAHHQNTIVVGVLAQTAFGYAAGGYDVICDGIIGPGSSTRFAPRARPTESNCTTSCCAPTNPPRCAALPAEPPPMH